jgi:hypothetical protein
MKFTLKIASAFVVAMLSLFRGFGQIDTPRIAPENDVRDLAKRSELSDFVIVGRVQQSTIVFTRLSSKNVEELRKSIETNGIGQEFTVEVEQVLCRHSDFQVRKENSEPIPKTLHVFVPRDEPHFEGPYPQEYLLEGRQYMLFLKSVDSTLQEQWTKLYELDPSGAYFRTLQYSRGAVLLPAATAANSKPEQPPVLLKLRPLCQALSATDPKTKLQALQKLSASGDPVLEQEARKASELLQQNAQ